VPALAAALTVAVVLALIGYRVGWLLAPALDRRRVPCPKCGARLRPVKLARAEAWHRSDTFLDWMLGPITPETALDGQCADGSTACGWCGTARRPPGHPGEIGLGWW
jgi:hypothetical protein